jgi:hypothetical protein
MLSYPAMGRMSFVATVLLCLTCNATADAQSAAADTPTGWTTPLTAWGDPDLQGIWDYRTLTPLERPERFKGREFLSEEEIADLEEQRRERADGRPPGDPRTSPSVHAPYWLDYGTEVVGSGRSSLIVDPPDGRIPALSDTGRHRGKARRETRAARGGADSYHDRNLWERCITRGLPNGMLPAGYNNNIQVLQTEHHVVIVNEMIHDARIVPLAAPTSASPVPQWRGRSWGRWAGDTLVVETTGFSASSDFRGAADGLSLVERFRLSGPDTLDYSVTVTDSATWTLPWTITFPIERVDGPMYEYACHEGNYGLENILHVARVGEAR